MKGPAPTTQPFVSDDFIARAEKLFQSRYNDVVPQWTSAIGNGIYSPRVDLAVGPFSAVHGDTQGPAYDKLFETSWRLLAQLSEYHRANTDDPRSIDEILKMLLNFNWNSRCFIAMEVENIVSQKHLLGGLVNASALGRIAIVVAGNCRSHNAFIRLRRFFGFLQEVGKNGFDPSNVLVISPTQCLRALQRR